MPVSTTKNVPTIIVPYSGPSTNRDLQDIFVYLRPETNGMLVESTMLKVLKSTKQYCSAMELIYMANFPGEFIMKNNIVEQYYALKLHYSVIGGKAFTPAMIKVFNKHFRCDFENSTVLGAFQALKELNMDANDLFNLWVNKDKVCIINGQTVKKINNIYIVNYDIPALVHKNNQGTDIAVMVFRTHLDSTSLQRLFRTMHKAIVEAKIISPQYDISRAFHYSKGIFEQILDGIAYLYDKDGKENHFENLTAVKFLTDMGVDQQLICGFLMNPTVGIDLESEVQEVNLFQHTAGMNYEEIYEVLNRIRYQTIIIHHGPLLQSICPCFNKGL